MRDLGDVFWYYPGLCVKSELLRSLLARDSSNVLRAGMLAADVAPRRSQQRVGCIRDQKGNHRVGEENREVLPTLLCTCICSPSEGEQMYHG